MAQATLVQALNAFYHNPDVQVKGSAEKWLQEFQESQEAWQVSDSLLHDPNSAYDVQYFCSQTLRRKVERDFEELPAGAEDSLRNSLFALLLKFKNGPPPVRTQLCLALTDLAAHSLSSQWGDGQGIVRWLAGQLGQYQDAIPALLECLTVLPQESESYRLALRPDRRRQLLGELMGSVPDVMALLVSCLKASEIYPIKSQILEAFAIWVRYGTGVASTDLSTHPLVTFSLDAINNAETFDAAVDVVCELVRYTCSGGSSSLATNMPLVKFIVSRMMTVRARFCAALAQNSVMANQTSHAGGDLDEIEDEDTIKGFSRVFAEMGEAFVEIIAMGSDDSLQLVQVMVEIAAHKEIEISSITFNFWQDLSSVLSRGPKRNYSEPAHNQDSNIHDLEKDRRIKLFQPYFGLLASLVSFRVMYPTNYDMLRKDELEEFKDMRYSIASLLSYIATVVGAEQLLQSVSQGFFKETESLASGSGWNPLAVEASLYCMRSIGELVSTSEQQVLPRVFDYIPKLPPHPLLFYTSSLTIDAYSDWLSHSTQKANLLPPTLTYLTSVISVNQRLDSTAAAAMAFRTICNGCSEFLVPSMPALQQLHSQILKADANPQGTRIDPKDELLVLEGICKVANALPPQEIKNALQLLASPVVASIQELLVSPAVGTETVASLHFCLHLDRLATIFMNIESPVSLASMFGQGWPLIQPLFRVKATDYKVMEKLGKTCKYAVTRCREHLLPFLGPVLTEIEILYNLHHHPACLYVASEVIKVFGQDPSCGPSLTPLIATMFDQTVRILSSLEQFTAHPDIADDCFLFASRCVRYCPQLIITQPVLPQLVSCAITGMLVQHREACISCLSFLKDVLHIPQKASGSGFRSTVEAIIGPQGPTLTRNILGALTGALPESRTEDVVEAMDQLSEFCGPVVSQWATTVLSPVPDVAISSAEKLAVVQALSLGSSGVNLSRFKSALNDLSDAARRSKKIMLTVQKSLGF